jgi:RNA polymerase sigma-70 factor (ECF subfamily)
MVRDGAISTKVMVGVMAKPVEETGYDDLVVAAKTQAGALGRLYDMYYERILRFCVHRLFNKATAEDITSSVFLTVARTMRQFKGCTEQDFRAWIYTIAANQANAYIRKTTRRKRLMENVVAQRRAAEPEAGDWSQLDWPTLYAAIGQLKPEHQTILTLRFFENLDYDEIGRIVDARPATIRVTLHRILKRLREALRGDLGEDE